MPEWKRETVTQVLEEYVDLSMVPHDRLVFAGTRGNVVHQTIASILLPHQNTIFIPQALVDEQGARGYIDSFRKWAELMIEDTWEVEKEIICDCFHFVGHVDWIGRLKGEKTGHCSVIDWKTPITWGKTWLAQCGAYRHLVQYHLRPEEIPVGKCGPVMLHKKGNAAKLRNDPPEAVTEAFTHYLEKLNADRYFEKGGKKYGNYG